MPAADTSLEFMIRPPELADATAMNELFIDRRADTSPGNPAYDSERIAWHQAYGIKKYRGQIAESRVAPERYFGHVAVVGKAVVGYTFARALPESEFTEYRGLIVHRNLEHRGMGRSLEARRRAWAASIGRPIRMLVAQGNGRSMEIFQRQGFRFVGTQEPTKKVPLTFNIMQLDVNE